MGEKTERLQSPNTFRLGAGSKRDSPSLLFIHGLNVYVLLL